MVAFAAGHRLGRDQRIQHRLLRRLGAGAEQGVDPRLGEHAQGQQVRARLVRDAVGGGEGEWAGEAGDEVSTATDISTDGAGEEVGWGLKVVSKV